MFYSKFASKLKNMITYDPKNLKVPDLHQLLLGAIGPRPIAFASTINKNGNVNLAPFSFFNVFSANPPILVFSPARSGRTGATKNTFDNVKEIAEVVINIVNYNMVYPMSLASAEYPSEINEFEKAGFTPVASECIRPPRVKESPVQFECKVNQVIELGAGGGAGNLIVCEVLRFHINPAVLNKEGKIDPFKIDLVARMGGIWYCRAQGDALFEVEKPMNRLGIGIDQLPQSIAQSKVLTHNDLAQLADCDQLPDSHDVDQYKKHYLTTIPGTIEEMHKHAQMLIRQKKIKEAWLYLLACS